MSRRLQGYVAEGLQQGATVPFTDILSILPDCPWLDWKVYRVCADVRMWDGAQHELSVRICGTCRELSFYPATGTQPARKKHYETFYPSIRWDGPGRRWARGEPTMDRRGAHWEIDLTAPDRVRRRHPAAA